jgi:hypothetical protein
MALGRGTEGMTELLHHRQGHAQQSAEKGEVPRIPAFRGSRPFFMPQPTIKRPSRGVIVDLRLRGVGSSGRGSRRTSARAFAECKVLRCTHTATAKVNNP